MKIVSPAQASIVSLVVSAVVLLGVGCDPGPSQGCSEACAEIVRTQGGTDVGFRECIRQCGEGNCTELCNSFGLDSEAGCRQRCQDASIPLNDLRFFIPIAATARIEIERTYRFPMGVSAEFDAPLNACALNVASNEGVLTGNFQRALPRGSDNSFSFQYRFSDGGTDDLVQWGLSDIREQEQWVSVPDGTVYSDCKPVTQQTRFVRCELIWRGEANGPNKPGSPQVRRASIASVDCLFTESGLAQYDCFVQRDCASDNECAVGVCAPDASCQEAPILTGFPCTLDDGSMGVCDELDCIESPCGGVCDDGDPGTFDRCDVFARCCDNDLEQLGCQGPASPEGSQ